MNPSTALATVLVDELIAGGVRDAVLSPGSRNAPLSMALHAAESAGRIRLHVRIDERTAGFLAVGLARFSGEPVVVTTTSGTAVANLHPAILEAHHGCVPLLVLSADRPPALRDVGANQVIDQRAVFSGAVRLFHEFGVPTRRAGQNAPWRSMTARAVAAARGSAGLPGPVHLNVPLAEPLLPDSPGHGECAGAWPESLRGRGGPWTVIEQPLPSGPAVPAPQPGERALFVAALGHSTAGQLATAGNLVVAEAGGAAGSGVLATGVHLLGCRDFLAANRPDRVIVLGRPTLFRPVSALLADAGITVDVVAPPAGYPDVAGSARYVAAVLESGGVRPDDDWAEVWRRADRLAAEAVGDALAGSVTSLRLARVLAEALPNRAMLVLGSSQSARDLGLAARPRDGLRLIANRGVAGIDGTVSTAVGAALAAQRDPAAGPVAALMGDLTLLHDATGLLIGPGEPRPDLTIVLSSNDGGAIFHTLEPGEERHGAAFERVFGTPHGVRIGTLAEAFGIAHRRLRLAELPDALAEPCVGIRVLEVPTDRHALRLANRYIAAAVADSLRDLAG